MRSQNNFYESIQLPQPPNPPDYVGDVNLNYLERKRKPNKKRIFGVLGIILVIMLFGVLLTLYYQAKYCVI